MNIYCTSLQDCETSPTTPKHSRTDSTSSLFSPTITEESSLFNIPQHEVSN